MNKNKIGIPIFSFLKSGGMRVLTQLANSWSEKGYSIDFIVTDSEKPYFPLNESINIIQLNYSNKFKKLMKYISLIFYLIKHFDSYEYIIANHNATALPIYIAAKIKHSVSKCWYYIQAYEPDFYKGIKPNLQIKKNIAILSYHLHFNQIVNSDIYKDYKHIHTHRVVYPGLDLKLYYPKNISFFNSKIKIGTIGRIEEGKGTSDVCKAMEILHSEGLDFEFYIAFNDFNTIPHHFVKPDGDENLSAFYREMDIVVAACKGQHGAIHYPIIETMAVGSSIVCTDYYPSNENNAYKVAASNPKQIAEAVKEIINNKQKAIEKREQAIKDVQQFSWPIVAEKFLNYLKEGK